MRKTLALLASAALMSLTIAAHATPIPDTYVTYYVTDGTLNTSANVASTDTFSGSFVFDVTTSKITAESIFLIDPANPGEFTGTAFSQIRGEGLEQGTSGPWSNYLGILTASPTTLCVAGNASCPYATQFFGPGGLTLYATSGNVSLTAPPPSVAPTPEPSSFVLLGTGILGLAGAARRRFLNA